MKMTATSPSSSAEVIADPAAFLKAVRATVPDFGYEAAAAVADALAEEEMLGEMASFKKAVTGVDNTIFISTKSGVRHGPRIKVAVNPPTHFSPSGDTASVDFDGEVTAGKVSQHALRQAQKFIELNRQALLDYWEERISTDELAQRLKSI
jgi:Domain of unknown function (DUF4160)